jgi:Tetratricopeptide repeat
MLLVTGEARAQLIAPYPYPSIGFGVQYSGGRLRIAGFVPVGPVIAVGPGGVLVGPAPFSVVERRIAVQPLALSSPRARIPEYDLSGIDLDVETPDKLYPPGTAPAPPRPPPAAGEKKAMPEPAPKLPAPKPEVPKPEPPKVPPEDDLLKPRPGAVEESQRLAELGIRAFRGGDYGLALWRFRQARDVDPNHAQAYFLMGQAHLAVGQHREAVAAIQDGLRLQPDWPLSKYRPQLDLYRDNPDDWREHQRRLDEGLRRTPDDPSLLFLYAYNLWFGGQRALAAEWFFKARARTADPRWIDLFLKHAPPPVVAAS